MEVMEYAELAPVKDTAAEEGPAVGGGAKLPSVTDPTQRKL